MARVLIVGCGYVGLEFARKAKQTGDNCIWALTRSADRQAELRSVGVKPIVGHWHDSAVPLPPVDSVLVSVPHREESGLGKESHIVGIRNLLERLPDIWTKFIYLSTTGVYGDTHDVVDEETPTEPTRIGPQIAVATEQFLATLRHEGLLAGRECITLRLAGIYGPGRIPLAEKLRAGGPLDVPQEGWLNLTHVSDIADTLWKMISHSMREQLYVLSDGHPVLRAEFYQHLAKLCGVSEPQFVPHDPTTTRGKRAGNKQVNPQRLFDELQLTMQFPSYREGLVQALQAY